MIDSFEPEAGKVAFNTAREIGAESVHGIAMVSIAISLKRIADAITTEHPNSLNLYGLINELMFNTRGSP